MAKPTVKPTWATDTNFTSGPANGNPTKVSPAGWPNVVQGFVPGDGAVAELVNKVINLLADYAGWIYDGSSAGAADAHVVETDSAGLTSVRGVVLTGADANGGYRVRQASISGTANTSFDGGTADSWYCNEPTAARTHTILQATAAKPLRAGMRTTIRRSGDGAFDILIHREGQGGGVDMAKLPASGRGGVVLEARDDGGTIKWSVESVFGGATLEADPGI